MASNNTESNKAVEQLTVRTRGLDDQEKTPASHDPASSEEKSEQDDRFDDYCAQNDTGADGDDENAFDDSEVKSPDDEGMFFGGTGTQDPPKLLAAPSQPTEPIPTSVSEANDITFLHASLPTSPSTYGLIIKESKSGHSFAVYFNDCTSSSVLRHFFPLPFSAI